MDKKKKKGKKITKVVSSTGWGKGDGFKKKTIKLIRM